MQIKILLVEDQKLMRIGIKSLFCDYPDLEIIGEAVNGKEAVEKAREEYEIAFKACREALSRWSAAERELVAVKNRNRSASRCSQTDDDFKRLIEKLFLI